MLRALFLLALSLLAQAAAAQSIAFTFDDGPRLEDTPLLSPVERNRALLAALAKHRVQAALFVTVANGADRPEGLALARAWGDAGHAIGNHTVTHPDLNSPHLTLAAYQRELLECDAVIAALPGYRRWFRFPYLREGDTPQKRDGMRAFLKAQGYRNAYVSLDTSDWRLDEHLVALLRRDPRADTSAVKAAYLDHLWQRAQAYRRLSQALQGRDIAQVILLHHNLINALWLDAGDVQGPRLDLHHPLPGLRRPGLRAAARTRRRRAEPAAVDGAQPGLGSFRRLGAAGGRRRFRNRSAAVGRVVVRTRRRPRRRCLRYSGSSFGTRRQA